MPKQLLYLTNTQLTATTWRGGSIAAGQTFENDEAGWLEFSAYLAASRKSSSYLLIDLIEEDFQRENIPHVLGKAKKALIQRRLTQLYRDTPYRHASPQGREKDGRKDDRMLFSALINAELPKPWLSAILKEQVPLAGIFSVALLSPLLFKKLGLGNEPLLLVTHQSSGLRQSYFHEGQLRFSRLTQLTMQSPAAIAEIANVEIGKTRQFLASTRVLQRDAQLSIVVVADADLLQDLQPLSPDTAAIHHRFVGLDEAARLLGLKNPGDVKLCDPLFLSLLANSRLSSHYTLFEQNRFYTLWQARTTLYLLSAAAVATGLFWGGANGLDLLDASQQTRQLELETRATEAQYQALIKSMPVTVANPHDMKSAVDLEQMISQNAPQPNALLGVISRALTGLPQIKINQLKWQASETDGSDADAARIPQGNELPPPTAALIGIPKKPFEIVTIEAEVVPFQNNYRTALESMQRFTEALGKNQQLQVTVVHPPLDTRPAVVLKGQAGKIDASTVARFDLKLVWKP